MGILAPQFTTGCYDPPDRLKARYETVGATSTTGGAGILAELTQLALACVNETSPARDAVAFALGSLLGQHAEDREERIVTTSDTYHLMAVGEEHLSHAVQFIHAGATDERAVNIIAALARMTPDRLRAELT
jgi:hypothetical protein